MFNFTNIILIIILFVDLLFYIPIPIHFYAYNNDLYFSVFSFLLIKKDKNNDINLLKEKIKLSEIRKVDKKKIKLISSIKFKKLYLNNVL